MTALTGQPTQTRDSSRPGPEPSAGPALIVVLVCDAPATGASRHSLAELDAVVIGRATTKCATRCGRRLQLGLPDPRLSSVHAQLVRDLDRWVIEDAGSKNGVVVNRVRRQRAVLDDGDLLELGHTVLMFRASRPGAARYADDCERADLLVPAAAPWFATFVPSLAAAFDDLSVVASTEAAILVLGETGTGAEQVARAAHALAGRSGPFVVVRCNALPEDGTQRQLLHSAQRGTVFFDELGDLAPTAQAALLRVLEDRTICSVGSREPVELDLQIVTATSHDVDALISQGRLRRDLHARVATFALRLPPLRARTEDLGLVIGELLLRAPAGRGATVRFTLDAARALLRYSWPFNLGELSACLVVASALARNAPIELAHLPEHVRAAADPASAAPEDPSPTDPRRTELIALLEQHAGNVSAVARASSRSRVQVHRWLRRLGVDASRFRR